MALCSSMVFGPATPLERASGVMQGGGMMVKFRPRTRRRPSDFAIERSFQPKDEKRRRAGCPRLGFFSPGIFEESVGSFSATTSLFVASVRSSTAFSRTTTIKTR
jgi:hypothetical protein